MRKKMRVEESEDDGGGIGYFPSDVLCDLLSRLPVKSLSRFKCVSKYWLNLINHERFVQLHLTRSIENGTGKFLRICTRLLDNNNLLNATCRFYTLEKEQDKLAAAPNVVSFRFPSSVPPSCNGLICYMTRYDKYQVCNPITHQTLTLPKPDFLNNLKGIDLTVMPGIGYNSNAKNYKVVIVCSTPTYSDVEIFTLGTKCWRKLNPQASSKQYESLLSNPCNLVAASAVYASGVLYWYCTEFCHDTHGNKVKSYSLNIVSFDFAEEKFKLILVPKDVDRFNHMCWICELQGCICLVERAEYGPIAKMWMLKKNHEWVTQKIPQDLIWVGSAFTSQEGSIQIVRRGNDEATLYSSVYNYQGQLSRPTEVHHGLHMYDFEVGQFHQESLVSLTSTWSLSSFYL